jgi:hypothetical protein
VKGQRCVAKLPPAIRMNFHDNLQYLVFSLCSTQYPVETDSEKLEVMVFGLERLMRCEIYIKKDCIRLILYYKENRSE